MKTRANTTTRPSPVAHLTQADLKTIGERFDAIGAEARASLGEADRRYIVRLIRVQRGLDWLGRLTIFFSLLLTPYFEHSLASWTSFGLVIAAGIFILAVAKILENMEIGHNILHGQWDWMQDPKIHSSTWEWDHACPSDQWSHSHNVVHHTWTNILEKDHDVGYGILRVTRAQPWEPLFIFQPFYMLVMALFFEWFIAFHDLDIPNAARGKIPREVTKRKIKGIFNKIGRQSLKDYILWPLLAGPFFLIVLLANLFANMIRNAWTFAVIICGHFPGGVHHFREQDTVDESRGHWYIRQISGSCNIRGGYLLHLMTGNLSHQIEHHMYPDLASNHYHRIAPQVEKICRDYQIPYHSNNLVKQVSSAVWQFLVCALPVGTRKSKLISNT